MNNENELLANVPEGITAAQAVEVFTSLVDLAKEQIRANVEITRINAMENVMITNIIHKYDLYHKLLAATFMERNKIIEKHFETIDKGINDNDHTLILGGLKSLADIVKDSPYGNFDRFSAQFDARALPPI